MTTVETVRGPIPVEELGQTLMHEHIFVMSAEAFENYGHVWGAPYWDEEERVADAIDKLRALAAGGIRTLVDPTVFGLGRFIPRIQRIAAEVELNVVVATGVYAFLELPNFFRYREPEQIAEFFIREFREGIDDTGVKPAFLKCAVEEHGVIGDLPRIVRAVALASIETGAPIMVHTNAAARSGLLALEAFTREGVDPTKVMIAHAGDSNDLEYLRAIADQGAMLGCDRFGIEHFNPTEKRIETVAKLASEGYADRIILSHDAACFYDFFTGDPKFAGEEPSYLLVSETVIPALRAAGVSQEAVDTMMVANAARFLGWAG